MSNFPVTSQRTIDEILLTEGIPMGWFKTDTVASTTFGNNIQIFSLDLGVGSYVTQPCFSSYITVLKIRASRDIEISLRVDNVANLKFKGPNDQVTPNGYSRLNTPILLKANELYEINMNQFQMLGWLHNFTIVARETSASAVTIFTNLEGYVITKNTNIRASNQLLWIGDSISYGTGATHFEYVTSDNPTQSSTANQEPFTQKVKKNLILKGHDFWLTNKAQSSMTTDGIVQAIKWGYYDNTEPNLICIMIGANDANNLGSGGLSVVGNQTIFTANINYILNYFSKRFKNAKILMIGSTPSSDNTTETRISTGRSLMSAAVTAFANPNVKYITCATSFDRTVSTNYLTADTIHPTAQNAIATTIITGIEAQGWFL